MPFLNQKSNYHLPTARIPCPFPPSPRKTEPNSLWQRGHLHLQSFPVSRDQLGNSGRRRLSLSILFPLWWFSEGALGLCGGCCCLRTWQRVLLALSGPPPWGRGGGEAGLLNFLQGVGQPPTVNCPSANAGGHPW